MTAQNSSPLHRTLGFWALLAYGVGDMLGSGVYGLVGKAAGIMGNAVWLAFAGSMVAAMLTGLSEQAAEDVASARLRSFAPAGAQLPT